MMSHGPATGVVVTLTTAFALAPSSVFAVDYMNAEQAAKLMFPQADRFESRTLTFDADQLRRLQAAGVSARSARWQVRVAQRDGATLGYVVVDDVIGKFELISYAVGIGSDGAIRQIEVLSY
ncbi:MAG TPA: FMN-binding protein, partial [Burkholderiaceae bacterium]